MLINCVNFQYCIQCSVIFSITETRNKIIYNYLTINYVLYGNMWRETVYTENTNRQLHFVLGDNNIIKPLR